MQLQVRGANLTIGRDIEVMYNPETGEAYILKGDSGYGVDMDLLIQSLKTIKTVADNAHKRKR